MDKITKELLVYIKYGVSGIVMNGDDVLLVRHTYGPAKGQLLIPGGHVEAGEMPDEAAAREVFEETMVEAQLISLVAARFRANDIWLIFLFKHVSGIPVSDEKENDVAIYKNITAASVDTKVTESTRFLLRNYLECESCGSRLNPYVPEGYNAGDYRFFASQRGDSDG